MGGSQSVFQTARHPIVNHLYILPLGNGEILSQATHLPCPNLSLSEELGQLLLLILTYIFGVVEIEATAPFAIASGHPRIIFETLSATSKRNTLTLLDIPSKRYSLPSSINFPLPANYFTLATFPCSPIIADVFHHPTHTDFQ